MHSINVSVAYATQDQQYLVDINVPRGTLAHELIELSGIKLKCPELLRIANDDVLLGVYSQKVNHDHLMEEGDRLEIYRPLTADPKEVRRKLALLGKTMGKK